MAVLRVWQKSLVAEEATSKTKASFEASFDSFNSIGAVQGTKDEEGNLTLRIAAGTKLHSELYAPEVKGASGFLRLVDGSNAARVQKNPIWVNYIDETSCLIKIETLKEYVAPAVFDVPQQ
jgi:hypothetical protein